MAGVRIAFFFFSIFFILFGCTSQPTLLKAANEASPIINSNSEQLDAIIQEGTFYISSRLPTKSKIGVVNMHSSSVNLSNYVIDSIVMHLVNSDNFIVVERSELSNIKTEQQYQLSGEVSDVTAISIGQQLGVQFIVTGSIMPLGNNYSLSLKITNVQTAQIMGTRIYTVRSDNVLLSLLNSSDEQSQRLVTETKETPQQVIMGDMNIINNNNTTIHGDVYVNKPSWFNQ